VAAAPAGQPAVIRDRQPISQLAHTDIYIGIDIGTSGIRAIAIGDHEQLLAEARRDLPAPTRTGPACEQDPAIWWQHCLEVLRELLTAIDRQRVRALCVDGTSGSVLLTDAQGQPLTTGLLYNDARVGNELARVQALAPTEAAVNAVTAGLPKLVWLIDRARHLPVRHIMHQADWLSFQLSGQAGVSDSNNCLKSGYDPLTRLWPDWLTQLGIERDWLPVVRSPGQVIGPVSPVVAADLGLPAETLIVTGTTDSTAAILATGARAVGDAVTSLGSTLVCKVISQQPVFAADYGVYSQPYGDAWLVGGASNSGGAVLRQFFSDTQMQHLSQQIDPSHPTGLNYYPLPAVGERFPVNDPQLTPRLTPRPDDDVRYFQGLLEGIAQIEYNAYRLLHELGAPYPSSLRSVGGGAMNTAWTQIRSRLLNVPMLTATHTEAAYGSALLARQGFMNNKETGA